MIPASYQTRQDFAGAIAWPFFATLPPRRSPETAPESADWSAPVAGRSPASGSRTCLGPRPTESRSEPIHGAYRIQDCNAARTFLSSFFLESVRKSFQAVL